MRAAKITPRRDGARVPLFLRVALAVVAVVALTLGLTMVLLSTITSRTVRRQHSDELVKHTRNISALTAQEVNGVYISSAMRTTMFNASDQLHGSVVLILGDPQTAYGRGYWLEVNAPTTTGLLPLTTLPATHLMVYAEAMNADAPVLFTHRGGQAMVAGQRMSDQAGNTGVIIVEMPVTQINLQIKDWFQNFSGILVAAMVLALFAATLVARSITRPLRAMHQTVRAIEQGHFDRRVNTRRQDELGDLGHGINVMAESLGNAQRSQAFFMASVSHELRAPMTSIQGFVQAVRDGTATGPTAEESLDIVLDECERLSHLIEVLMMLMRAQASDTPLAREWMSTAKLLEQATRAIGGKVQDRDISFEIKADAACQAQVNTPLMLQVLVNILDNALRYSTDGGTITLCARQDADATTFWIDDCGPGMDVQTAAHLFEDFYTANTARTPGHGLGLGLSIAKRVVMQHHGEIRAENLPQGGCRIAFFVLNDF